MRTHIKKYLHLGCWVKSTYLPYEMRNEEDYNTFYKVVVLDDRCENIHIALPSGYGWVSNPDEIVYKNNNGCNLQHCMTGPTNCWGINIQDIEEIKGYFSSHD